MARRPAPQALQKQCVKCKGLNHVRKIACSDCGGKRFNKFTHIAVEVTKEADGDSDDADSDQDEQESDEESDDAGAKKKSHSDEGAGEDAGDSDGDDDEDDDSSGGGGDEDDDNSDDDGDDDDSDDDATTKQIANTKKREKKRELLVKAREFWEEQRGVNPSMMRFYPGPRRIGELNAETLAGVGWAELTRDGAELRALEHFEFHGLLPKQFKKKPNEIVFTYYDCFKKYNNNNNKKKRTADPNSASLCLRIRWGLDISTGEWLCTCINSKYCNGEQVRRTRGATGPKTTAYLATQLAPLLVPHVSNTSKLTPKVAMPHLLQ